MPVRFREVHLVWVFSPTSRNRRLSGQGGKERSMPVRFREEPAFGSPVRLRETAACRGGVGGALTGGPVSRRARLWIPLPTSRNRNLATQVGWCGRRRSGFAKCTSSGSLVRLRETAACRGRGEGAVDTGPVSRSVPRLGLQSDFAKPQPGAAGGMVRSPGVRFREVHLVWVFSPTSRNRSLAGRMEGAVAGGPVSRSVPRLGL